jgi:hypothetical protein
VLISFPAPALCQGGDEDLLVALAEIVYPGFVRRSSAENGLRLWIEGDPVRGRNSGRLDTARTESEGASSPP